MMLSRNVVKQNELTGLMAMFNGYFTDHHAGVKMFYFKHSTDMNTVYHT